MSSEPNFKDLETDITDLLDKEMKEQAGILGMTVSSHGGTHLASKFKKEVSMTKTEISAASSSLVFLASKMLQDSLNQKISYNLITGAKRIVLSILTENIAMICYLNRKLAELEGLDIYKPLEKIFHETFCYHSHFGFN